MTILKQLGYDLVAVGNHEFDDGPANLTKQLRTAKLTALCCNLDLTREPELAASIVPSVIKTINGQPVGFIGVITPDLEQIASNRGGIRLKATGTDWMKPVRDEVNRLKDRGLNKIILVTHCGIDCDKELAQALPDVDAIIGGHTHTRLDRAVVIDHPSGGCTIIVQTGCFGRALGKLDLCFDSSGHIIKDKTDYHLINITEKIFEEPDIKAYIDEKERPFVSLRREIAASAAGNFSNRFRNLPWDSALGDLICDALFEAGKDYGAEIAFENRGGIRVPLTKDQSAWKK